MHIWFIVVDSLEAPQAPKPRPIILVDTKDLKYKPWVISENNLVDDNADVNPIFVCVIVAAAILIPVIVAAAI